MKTPKEINDASTESTDFDRFQDFAKKIVAVPKKEIDQKQAEYERQRKVQKRKVVNTD